MVFATQNPIEYEGTFPLPEAQLDRFLMRLPIGYPTPTDEIAILRNLRQDHPINHIGQVVEIDEILALLPEIRQIHLDSTLEDYIVRLVAATREHPDLALGASPRGSLALYKASQALAAIRGRDHVLPDDVKYLAPLTLLHRLIPRPEAELRGRTATVILQDILNKVPLEIGELA
jgi:MoxR-like ATPase